VAIRDLHSPQVVPHGVCHQRPGLGYTLVTQNEDDRYSKRDAAAEVLEILLKDVIVSSHSHKVRLSLGKVRAALHLICELLNSRCCAPLN
jgi:hypothetical protein